MIRNPFRSRRPGPDGDVIAFGAEFRRHLDPKMRAVIGKYAGIEQRRDAGESAAVLAAEFGVPVDCVNDLKGFTPPVMCVTPGHEDRPATVSLRLPGMDDWPASPNVCGPCADEAMYPLAVKAARADAALREVFGDVSPAELRRLLAETGLTALTGLTVAPAGDETHTRRSA